MGRNGKGKGRRICTKKYSYVNLSWPGLPVVYLPCPHQHLKTPTIDRKSIDREQHLNLLSTPKGYRWDNQQDCNKKQTPPKTPKKKFLCIEAPSENNNKQCKNNSMDDVWKCMTPELLEKLINLFVNDFHMTRNEAKDFLCEQKDANKMMQKMAMCQCPCASGDNGNMWMKEFSELIACRMRNHLALVLCGRRTKRQKMLMELVVNFMSDISGECINIACPETRMHRIMVYAADRIAVWLDRMFDESEKKLLDEDAAKEMEDEEKKKKKLDEERLRREQEERERLEREAAEAAAAAAAAEAAAAEAAAVEEPMEEEPPPAEAPPEEPAPVEAEPEPAEPPPPPPEPEIGAGEGEPAPVVEEVKVEVEPEPAPVEEAGEGDAEPEEPEPEPEEEPEEEAEEEVVEVEEEIEVPVEEIFLEEEISAPPAFDPMSIIVDWIKETEYAKTDRQEEISKIVKSRLKLGLDGQDIEGLDAVIDALGNQVSTWIDKLANEAEKEIKPLIKAKGSRFGVPKGVLYHIKRGSDNYYKVKQVSCADLEAKKERIDMPMTSDDVKNFTKWAEGLIKVSDAWTRWVENAFCEAYTMYNRNINQPDELTATEFKFWRDAKRKEAIEWKRTQKSIFSKAKRWQDWAQFTKYKIQGEPSSEVSALAPEE